MDGALASQIVRLKKEFVAKYDRNAHLYEFVPDSSELFSIDPGHLELLHIFAKNNPIYSDSFKMDIGGMECSVYEGDISNYWLDSIKHDTSYAPFYPTWILSAYALADTAKSLKITHAVDIGSGDGRIAYCCKMLGIASHGIEIDENLAALQKTISAGTGVDFESSAADATRFDYAKLNLGTPVFFIGGLPEVGEILAQSVIENVLGTKAADSAVFVLTGTRAKRQMSQTRAQWGWDDLIQKFNLDVIGTVTVPTRWTVDQPDDTPYVFARRRT